MTAVFEDTVESLSEQITRLVSERQALRAAAADAAALEQNRLEIARLQQRLSAALIHQYGPAAA
jgi:regulator of replication initiation timing